MRLRPTRVAFLLLLCGWRGGAPCAHGQIAAQAAVQTSAEVLQQPPIAGSTAGPASEVPRVPGISGRLRGLNAGVSVSALHDAETGYAALLQPAVSYAFNDVYSVDATIPIYLYRLAPSRRRNATADHLLVDQELEAGDLLVALHAQFQPHGFDTLLSVSATAPTGDALYGLTSGRPTFNFSSRLDRTFHCITPTVELGVGNSSTVVNQLVLRDYSSLGPLAHFQAGAGISMPRGASFETDAYEQLPLGDQKIYDSFRTGMRGGTRTVVAGRGVAEDNGFTSILNMPMDGHVTLSAYYNRSLRFRDDVVSFGLSYVLRSARIERTSADNELLQHIEDELATAPAPAAKRTTPLR